MKMRMSSDDTMIECFLCGREFQYGGHIYNGRRVPAWDVWLCDVCDKGNRDGIANLTYQKKVAKHLKTQGLPAPPLNDKGWVPIP
jgi:hypothetical protein